MEQTPKRRKYDAEFKLKVVNFSKVHGNHKAAEYFDIDKKSVIEWKKEENILKTIPKKKKCSKNRCPAVDRIRKCYFRTCSLLKAEWKICVKKHNT